MSLPQDASPIEKSLYNAGRHSLALQLYKKRTGRAPKEPIMGPPAPTTPSTPTHSISESIADTSGRQAVETITPASLVNQLISLEDFDPQYNSFTITLNDGKTITASGYRDMEIKLRAYFSNPEVLMKAKAESYKGTVQYVKDIISGKATKDAWAQRGPDHDITSADISAIHQQQQEIKSYIENKAKVDDTLRNLKRFNYDVGFYEDGSIKMEPPEGMSSEEQIYLETKYAPSDAVFELEDGTKLTKEEALAEAKNQYQLYNVALQQTSAMPTVGMILRGSPGYLVKEAKEKLDWKWAQLTNASPEEIEKQFNEAYEAQLDRQRFQARESYAGGKVIEEGDLVKILDYYKQEIIFVATMAASAGISAASARVGPAISSFLSSKGVTTILGLKPALWVKVPMIGLGVGLVAPSVVSSVTTFMAADDQLKTIKANYKAKLTSAVTPTEKNQIERTYQTQRQQLDDTKMAAVGTLFNVGFTIAAAYVVGSKAYKWAVKTQPYAVTATTTPSGKQSVTVRKTMFGGTRMVGQPKPWITSKALRPVGQYGKAVTATRPPPISTKGALVPVGKTGLFRPPTFKPKFVGAPKAAPITAVSTPGAIPWRTYAPVKKPGITFGNMQVVTSESGIKYLKPITPGKTLTPASDRYPGSPKIGEFPGLVPTKGPAGEFLKPKEPSKILTPPTSRYPGPSKITFGNLEVKTGPGGIKYLSPKTPAKVLTKPTKRYPGSPKIGTFPGLKQVTTKEGLTYFKPKKPSKVLTDVSDRYPGASRIEFKKLELSKGPAGEFLKPKTPAEIKTPISGRYVGASKIEFKNLVKGTLPGGMEFWTPKVPGKVLTPETGYITKSGYFGIEKSIPRMRYLSTLVWPKMVLWEPKLGFFTPKESAFGFGYTKAPKKIFTMTDLYKKGVLERPPTKGTIESRTGQLLQQVTKTIPKQVLKVKTINQKLITESLKISKAVQKLRLNQKTALDLKHDVITTTRPKPFKKPIQNFILEEEQYWLSQFWRDNVPGNPQLKVPLQKIDSIYSTIISLTQGLGRELITYNAIRLEFLSAQSILTSLKQMQTELQKQLQKLKQGQTIISKQFPLTASALSYLPLQSQMQSQAQMQSQMQMQRQLQLTQQIQQTRQRYFFRLDSDKKKKKKRPKAESFQTYIKKDATKAAKYVKASKHPVPTMRQAKGLGVIGTDRTVARTFKVESSKQKPRSQPKVSMVWGTSSHKYRKPIKKGKPIKSNKWIEKSKYAIDSKGELEGITFKGLAALKQRGRSKPKFKKPKFKPYRPKVRR